MFKRFTIKRKKSGLLHKAWNNDELSLGLFHFGRGCMKLKQILQQHLQVTSRLALPGVLGDAYLCKHNPVFYAIRKESRRLGFKFTTQATANYDILPLTQLPYLLKHKVIPYKQNVRAIEEIEALAPGVFHLQDIPPFASNTAFHESAHGVAQELCTQSGLRGFKTDAERALLILFQESFANACESISNVYARSRFHDEFLYKNSYVMEKPKNREALRASVREYGFETTFKILLLSFFQANLDQTDRADARLNEYLEWLEIKVARAKRPILTSVFRIGFDLDPQFVLFTNAFCLRLMGIRTPFAKLQDFKTTDALRKDGRWLHALDRLTQAVSST